MLCVINQNNTGVDKMILIKVLLLLVVLFKLRNVACISIPPTETTNSDRTVDIINAGYEQCKPSNEVCSTNNDCCSNCCTSFTYSAMTCQDECPNNHNTNDKGNNTHGNVVWKSKQPCKDDGKSIADKTKDSSRVISRHHRENQNNGTENFKEKGKSDGNSLGTKVDDKTDNPVPKGTEYKQISKLGDLVQKKVEPKPNKDIGIRINDEDDSNINSREIGIKTRENVEVGLSVMDINKGGKDDDSSENQNTDIGTPIIIIGDKPKEDDSGENQNTDIGTSIIKIVEKSKNKLGEKMKTLNEKAKHAHSKESSNNDMGNVITIQTINADQSRNKYQRFNNIKLVNNKTTLESKGNSTTEDLNGLTVTKHTNTTQNKTQVTSGNKTGNNNATVKTKTTVGLGTQCTGDKCDSSQSLAEDIKKIIIQKLPSMILLTPTKSTTISEKPVCKAAGSSCKNPSQCCSQCCAVSDGTFKCFDKGTDECQSWVPGKTAPKCKEPGETCETHGECCLNKCTDCGHFSKCDNESQNICRVEGKSVTLAVHPKLCKNLGDICGEASECCTQCCAVSAGVFKCFEEGTHECQPGDNVSNTTISEFVEVEGFEN